MLKRLALAIILIIVSTSISQAAIKPGSKCNEIGAIYKTKNQTLICAKSGKNKLWKVQKKATPSPSPTPTVTPTLTPTPTPSSTPSPSPSAQDLLLISPVPNGFFNTSFMNGKPQSRDIGQSLIFDSTSTLTKFAFQVAAFTWISPEYHLATEDKKHDLEKPINRGDYEPITARINASLWKDESNSLKNLPEKFDLRSGFSKVVEFEVNTKITIGENFVLEFPKEVTVEPGYYFLNLYFVIDDLHVTTLRFAGRQTGNNQFGGVNRNVPSTCTYTPAPDTYPAGQAYFSIQDNKWDTLTPEQKWNYQTPRSYSFIAHYYAKVVECIKIGSYNDIFNTGDIFLEIYGRKN